MVDQEEIVEDKIAKNRILGGRKDMWGRCRKKKLSNKMKEHETWEKNQN